MRHWYLIVVVGFAAVLVFAGGQNPRNTMREAEAAKESARQKIKTTDEYIALTNALRKYEADYTQATNKIASVSDNNTRQALNKVMDAVDSLKTVTEKLRRVDLMIGSGDVNAPN
jgi:hypothetical protein